MAYDRQEWHNDPEGGTPINASALDHIEEGIDEAHELAEAAQVTANNRLESVVAGDNVTVDDTDPLNPIVSAEAGGGGGTISTSDGTTVNFSGDGSGGSPLTAEVQAIANAHIAGGAAIALSKLATDPLARANHTGTQLLATISDVTASAAELNTLDGVTASAAELNILDGATLTVTELNHVDGVTSAIQTQLDAKAPLASPVLTGNPTAPTPTAGDNDTSIATTAFVTTAVAAGGGGFDLAQTMAFGG